MTAAELSEFFTEDEASFMNGMACAMNVVSDFDREVQEHLDRLEAKRKREEQS